jgi:hypothetical protein
MSQEPERLYNLGESIAPAVEPVALAVEPETLPVVMAEPKTPIVEEVKPEVKAVSEEVAASEKSSKGKKIAPQASSTQIADGSAVYLSKIVFESLYSRNSNSVVILQTRLVELGYTSARDDKQGWISVGTAKALEDFKSDNAVTASLYSQEMIEAVFVGTSVKVLP